VAGILVGSGIAFLLVQILRGLFVLDPTIAFPLAHIALLAALVLVATVASALAATEILRRLRPTEILREE
jgi:ABC-type antimicrobial peptide transport system permease subunit